MITITQDSEFMVNLLPANPIPAGKRFKIFQDQDANVAIFSLGEDSVLSLIITENVTTTQLAPVQKDFGQICKFSGTVQAFDFLQKPDNSLSIVVVTDAGNNLCNLYILNNIMPADLLKPNPNLILFAGSSYPMVYDIFLSNFSQTVGQTTFPLIFLAMNLAGSITQSSQLGYLDISLQDGGGFNFSLDTTWRLATDPVQILSVAFGFSPLGHGAFVLYTASDGPHLQFCTFQGTGFASEMQCPSGALHIDSFVNPTTKYSELIVGGDAITKFTYRQYCVGSGTGTPIATGVTSLGIKDIHVVQSGDNLTIWYTTITHGVHYYSAPIATPASGELIQLPEEGMGGGQLSPMIVIEDRTSGLLVNTLVSADGGGSLTLLQNASDTGMWQKVPFFLPSASNNMEIPSFTIRFSASSDDTNQPVAACQLHIITSGSVKAFSNGGSVVIDQTGRWYQADNDGVVSIIVETDDMASFTFQVDQYQTPDQATTLPIQSLVLNPNSKMNAKMALIKTGQDLLNAKTQSGDKLITPGTISADDANHAALVITELNRLQLVQGQPTNQLRRFNKNRSFYNPNNGIPTIVAGKLPHGQAERDAFMKAISLGGWHDGWGIFPWLKEKASAASSWVLTKLGDVWDFVVQLGGYMYRFAMDSVEAIGKALTWVFQNITVGIKKLIDYLGFVFNWGDILATSDSIVALLNASLSYGADQILGLKAQKTTFLNQLKASMGARVAPETTAAGSGMKDPNETSSMNDTKNSVAYNWTSYQVSYSGMGKNGSITNAVSALHSSTDKPTMEDLWTDVSNIFHSVEGMVNNMANDVQNLFSPTTTTTDIWNRLTQALIQAALNTIENVADFLLDALSLVLTSFQHLGNQAIQLPIFSSLWKTIAGPRPFTVFNALALILAIPTTIIYKVVLGRAPPLLAKMTKADFAAYLSGTMPTPMNGLAITRKEIAIVLGSATITALHLQKDFQALSFLYKTVTGAKAETLDTCMIFLGIVSQVAVWPVKSRKNMGLKWTVWFMDSSNVLALALGRFAGWKTGTSRADTAPLVTTWAALNNIPSFALRIIIDIDADSGNPSLLTRHIVQSAFTMVKSWLDAIGEIATDLKVKTIAQIGGNVCLGLKLLLLFVDFWIAAEPGFQKHARLLMLEFQTGRCGNTSLAENRRRLTTGPSTCKSVKGTKTKILLLPNTEEVEDIRNERNY